MCVCVCETERPAGRRTGRYWRAAILCTLRPYATRERRKRDGEERQRRELRVFVLASIEAKPPPPTPWGLSPRPHLLPGLPPPLETHPHLPSWRCISGILFLHLHTHPFHCELSHWQSPKENKCNVSGSWWKLIFLTQVSPTGPDSLRRSQSGLARASWVRGPRLHRHHARSTCQAPTRTQGSAWLHHLPTAVYVLLPFTAFPGRTLRAAKCPQEPFECY